jgi:predicted thioredoxin/glutaredoxin
MLGSLGPEAMSRVSVEKVNIEENEKLMDKYSLSIPVILVDGDVVAESIVDVPKVRKLIQQKLEKSG